MSEKEQENINGLPEVVNISILGNEPASIASDNYTELRAQLGDQASTFYGPQACGSCGELIVKRAIEQGGEAFTLPKLPGEKYEPHICDPASSKADHIAPSPAKTDVPAGAEGIARALDATNELVKQRTDVPATQPPQPDPSIPPQKHPLFVAVRALLDHFQAEPKHALLQTLLDNCEREYKNTLREIDEAIARYQNGVNANGQLSQESD